MEIQLHLGNITNKIKQTINYYDKNKKVLKQDLDKSYEPYIRKSVLLLNTITEKYRDEFNEDDQANPDLIYDFDVNKSVLHMEKKINKILS